RLWRILTGNCLVLSVARGSLPAPAAKPRESRRGDYAPQAALHEPDYFRHNGLPVSPHDAEQAAAAEPRAFPGRPCAGETGDAEKVRRPRGRNRERRITFSSAPL